MKNLYAIALFIFCSWISNAQNVTFLDPVFKYYLITKPTVDTDGDNYPDAFVDTNQDGEIQISEAAAVTGLIIYNNTPIVSDVSGIEAFSNLTFLKCQAPILPATINQLTNLETLDVMYGMISTNFTLSGMPNLKTINCSGTQIDTINLSNLPSLETLNCTSNHITTLDCSGLLALKELDASNCSQMTTLNVSGLTNLTTLSCNSDPLVSLNLTDNVNLKSLRCSNYSGTTIDLSHLINLETLSISAYSLTSLDLSNLTALHTLECGNLVSLNVLDISNLPALKYVYCASGGLTGINTVGTHNLEELSCSGNRIISLDVSNMPNLVRLWCYNNQISTLNVSAATALTDLDCSNNLISSLDVTNLTNLEFLNCSDNQISTLEVSNLIHLVNLRCSNNTIASLNTTALTNLAYLDFADNAAMSSIDLSNMNDLRYLYCQNNNMAELNIAHLTKLKRLDCSNNHISELAMPTTTTFTTGSHNPPTAIFDCSKNLFSTLDFSTINCNTVAVYLADNPNLTQVNLKNSVSRYKVRNMFNCPNLRYICINDYTENPNLPYGGVFSSVDVVDLANVQINTYCSFNPGGNYNTITGIFSMDIDNNGCDDNDFHFPNGKILIDNTPSIFRATYTDTDGNYNFYTQSGDFVITPEFENPYFTISPASATLNFAEANSSVQTQNFCILPNGIHNDIEITLIPLSGARPGFDTTYKLAYKNKGNQMLSGNISLAFDDAVLDLISANPAISQQTLNTLNWDYSLLKPFESRSITLTLNVNSPQEIPAVNVGDHLNFTATINPVSGDETTDDNTSTLVQLIRGAVDPNDKTCLEGNTLTPEMVGGYLHYVIRFQNSGTAPAENVVVKDIIDTNKFDITSLELTSTSHPQVTKITGNKVEFQFQNINLPFESEDEPGSHGHIAFKIKTKANLVIGDSVENKADIYFDYNFPVVTNTATTTVAPLLGLDAIVNTSVAIAPNPTKGIVHIISKDNITSVQLFDVQGRILETVTVNHVQLKFDLSQKPKGIYFVKVFTAKGMKVEKIIKE